MFKLVSLSLKICIMKNAFHRKLSWEIFDLLNTFQYCRKDPLSHVKTDSIEHAHADALDKVQITP